MTISDILEIKYKEWKQNIDKLPIFFYYINKSYSKHHFYDLYFFFDENNYFFFPGKPILKKNLSKKEYLKKLKFEIIYEIFSDDFLNILDKYKNGNSDIDSLVLKILSSNIEKKEKIMLFQYRLMILSLELNEVKISFNKYLKFFSKKNTFSPKTTKNLMKRHNLYMEKIHKLESKIFILKNTFSLNS